jgi:hypothetical protein
MVYTVSSTKLGLPLVCPKTPSQKKKKKKRRRRKRQRRRKNACTL